MFNKTVSCSNCKCKIDKKDAQKIAVTSFPRIDCYYCGKCEKPYDSFLLASFLPPRFYKKMEVDKNGEPIGYKKIDKINK